MVEFSARKVNGALVPTGRAGEIELDRLPANTRLKVKAVVPRNGKHHAGTWAFFTLVASALNSGPTAAPWRPEDVKDHLLIATGRSRPITVNGVQGFVPVHTNFDAMSADEYGRFVEEGMLYVRDHLAPWIERAPEWPDIRGFLVWARVEEPEGAA